MHYSGEPAEVSISEEETQSLKDFDMKMTTCRTEAKLYMCINGQWVWDELYIMYKYGEDDENLLFYYLFIK